ERLLERAERGSEARIHALFALLGFARHGVLDRPQLAPGDPGVFDGTGEGAPVGRGGIEFRSCFGDAFDDLVARGEVLGALGLELLEVGRHRRVGGLQSAVEREPQRLVGRAAELVELLPALAQLVDRFGVRLEVELLAGPARKRLGLADELLAALAAAPALPVAQPLLLLAQRIDASGERRVRRAGLERGVDRGHEARELCDLTRGVRGLRELDLALHSGEVLLPLLRAFLAFARAARIALELAFVGARVVPLGEAVRENRLQSAVR